MEDRNNQNVRKTVSRPAGGRQPEVQQIDISRKPPIRENQPHRMDMNRQGTGRPTGARPTGAGTQGNRPGTRPRSAGSYPNTVRKPLPQQKNHRTVQNGRRRKRRRRNRGRGGAGIFFFLLLLILAGGAGFLYGRVNKAHTLEAGQSIDPSALVRYGEKAPEIVENLTAEQVRTPGEYQIKVKLLPFSYEVKVTVADTLPPEAEVQEVCGMYGEQISPELFVTGIQDGTDVAVSYETEPNYSQAGVQDVKLLLTDKGGNITRLISKLVVSNLKRELVLEAGSAMPEANAFLEDIAGFENTQISYVTDPAAVDTAVLGSQEIKVLLDGRETAATLTIVDTIAPVMTVKPVDGWVGKPIAISDFIQSLTEATEVTYSYAEEPDWSKEGSGSAQIIVADAAGNTVQEQVTYTLKKDITPPEVAVSSIDIVIGEPVSYKKAVGYSDNSDSLEELKLEIDNSKVDPNTEGKYEVTYTVTDMAGNVTSKKGTVFVMAEKPIYYDEDVINAEADKVLAEIIKDDMSQLEKARAIYNWVHSHIGYINHSEKGDRLRGAYEGLVKRQGDCFVYASTSKALLTRAGIENMDIVKSTVNPSHYWNLVDVGDGWYHFDATPRKDKTVFFMWTDAELKEYSEKNKNSHIYDAAQYPEIN